MIGVPTSDLLAVNLAVCAAAALLQHARAAACLFPNANLKYKCPWERLLLLHMRLFTLPVCCRSPVASTNTATPTAAVATRPAAFASPLASVADMRFVNGLYRATLYWRLGHSVQDIQGCGVPYWLTAS